jgi:hypothetical protein
MVAPPGCLPAAILPRRAAEAAAEAAVEMGKKPDEPLQTFGIPPGAEYAATLGARSGAQDRRQRDRLRPRSDHRERRAGADVTRAGNLACDIGSGAMPIAIAWPHVYRFSYQL